MTVSQQKSHFVYLLLIMFVASKISLIATGFNYSHILLLHLCSSTNNLCLDSFC